MTVEATFDIELENSKGYYDISLDSVGDIVTKDSFTTTILMNVYCEKRALASEMPMPNRRRGWIGNESTPGREIGSKLWLFYQSRLTLTIMNEMAAQLESDFQWFISTGLLQSVSAEVVFSDDEVGIQLVLRRHQSETETRYYKLWDRTT